MITVESRNIVVIYSNKNSKGKHDATGAFVPEARAFQLVHGVPDNNMCGVNCRQTVAKRRIDVMQHLYAVGRDKPIDGVAFFGHGWPNGIQFGFNRSNSHQLVDMLRSCTRDYLEVVLYCCLTAENDVRDKEIKRIGPATVGGFADQLAFQLACNGVVGHVDAHKTSGHTTWNPYVIRFQNLKTGPRAAWLVEPGSESWKAWVTAVKGTNMRFEFPFMTELQIKTTLTDMLIR